MIKSSMVSWMGSWDRKRTLDENKGHLNNDFSYKQGINIGSLIVANLAY